MKLIWRDEGKLSEALAGFFFAGLIAWREKTHHSAQSSGGQREVYLLLPTFLDRARKIERLSGATGNESISLDAGGSALDVALLSLFFNCEEG